MNALRRLDIALILGSWLLSQPVADGNEKPPEDMESWPVQATAEPKFTRRVQIASCREPVYETALISRPSQLDLVNKR